MLKRKVLVVCNQMLEVSIIKRIGLRPLHCSSSWSVLRIRSGWSQCNMNTLQYIKKIRPSASAFNEVRVAAAKQCLILEAALHFDNHVTFTKWKSAAAHSAYGGSIPHICHRHHRRCLCKMKLPHVNFYRFNAKNWQFTV